MPTFRALFLPADTTEVPQELKLEAESDIHWAEISRFLKREIHTSPDDNDTFLEVVRTVALDRLRIGDYDPHIHVVMVVDEEGQDKQLPLNLRAMAFYGGPIWGNVILVAEDHHDPSNGYEVVSLHDYVTPRVITEVTGHINAYNIKRN